jgi:hypothetical protein
VVCYQKESRFPGFLVVNPILTMQVGPSCGISALYFVRVAFQITDHPDWLVLWFPSVCPSKCWYSFESTHNCFLPHSFQLIIHSIIWGSEFFQKCRSHLRKSQKGVVKQVPLWGPTNIRHHCTKCNLILFDMICLTAVGLTPGSSSTVHIYTQTIHRTTQLTQTIHRTTQFTN